MIWLIILTALSGLLYRLGGYGRPFNTKYRDIGCAVCVVLAMMIYIPFHWTMLVCGVLLFGSLTTYWDKVNLLLPVADKGREYWWNWALTGLGYGLAMLPYAVYSGGWNGFWLRALFLSVSVCLVSVLSGDDDVEEVLRGVLIVASVPIAI